MLRSFRIILVFVCFAFSFKGQVNFVPNPSFEQYNTCPDLSSHIGDADYWFNPSSHSPDYFNFCSPNTYYWVPINFFGSQIANTGDAYAGIGAACYNGTREYIAIRLIDSLVAGKKYYIEFFVSLSDSSNYATDDIGMYFSNDSISISTIDSLGFIPQIQNQQGFFLIDKINWVKIQGHYIAGGGKRMSY
jgi:OOP family OmpA-OmpF porin